MEQGKIKRGLSRQLITYVLLIVAALAGVIVVVTSRVLTHDYERRAKIGIERTSLSIKRAVETFVEGAYNLGSELAESPSILTMDPDVMVPMLRNTFLRNEYIELLYVQGTDGIQIARSDGTSGGSRRDRFWFREIMEHRQAFISNSYYSVATHLPCVSVFFPMFKDREMIGVFAMDIELQYLQQLVERLSDSKSGELSFIIDGGGNVLAHPNKEYIERQVNFKNFTRTENRKDDEGRTMLDEDGNVATYQVPYEVSDEYRAAINRVLHGAGGTEVIRNQQKVFFISYAPINIPGYSESWAVISMRERSEGIGVVSMLVRALVLITIIIAVVAAFVFAIVVRKKILKPIRALILAAEQIVRGESDARLPPTYKTGNEISALTAAMRGLLEHSRVYLMTQTQTQKIFSAQFQFDAFVREAISIQQAFRMALVLLRKQYATLKITLVYADPDVKYTLTYNKSENSISDSDSFSHNAHVANLIAGKNILFMNAFAIREQNINYIDESTQLLCIIPLVAKGKSYGYIIIESDDRGGLSIVKEEKFLEQAALDLAEWIAVNKNIPLLTADIQAARGADDGAQVSGDPLDALRDIEGLDVDTAIDTMGGLDDLYERSVRLFTQLLPETLKKAEDFLNDGDMKGFAVEVHGIKGSLNNIGAALGHRAAWVEKAAKEGDISYCLESYPIFRELLLDFGKKLERALSSGGGATSQKDAGDKDELIKILDKAKGATDMFDAFSARDVMAETANFSYGENTDSQLREIDAALARFDCEAASKLINILKGDLL